ncbi:hypothetical protein RvY_12387-2 [Ramazzottius varieornatus]|uniref:Uncharacterized protein n=1 Tax=Ramazzottius varieornatus TaxID=947166 RepID=A0A1D1VJC7_RAMVA|nr:hypothetical protein RvY_12387-2 [Ramazzottius varieornatus]
MPRKQVFLVLWQTPFPVGRRSTCSICTRPSPTATALCEFRTLITPTSSRASATKIWGRTIKLNLTSSRYRRAVKSGKVFYKPKCIWTCPSICPLSWPTTALASRRKMTKRRLKR